MQFSILSHAGLKVTSNGKELICDPWLLGSCYWRSWWNYPPVPEELVKSLRPDFIYITHLHWDHFHGPSLKKFPRETRIFVPLFLNDRMKRDLVDMGFPNVTEIAHGQRIQLSPELSIQSYHIGPVFGDSALVIEAEGVVILNANDAKLAGLPLHQILSDHPRIDFCMRSHSSANARNCMHITDGETATLDDETQYLRSFDLFMRKVKPTYAIPFASNSCLLHKDTFGMNEQLQTPLAVKEYFEKSCAERPHETKVKIMIAGDSWDQVEGFNIATHDYFENRSAHLEAYRNSQREKLEKYYATERKIKVSLPTIQEFAEQISRIAPRRLLKKLRGVGIAIISRSDDSKAFYEIDAFTGTARSILENEAMTHPIRIEIPAHILLQSIRLDMFAQAWISKRVHYYSTKASKPQLDAFLNILGSIEGEVVPRRKILSFRALRAVVSRWRELVLYIHAGYLYATGKTLPEIEARLLGAKI